MDKGPRKQEKGEAFKPQYRSHSVKGVCCRKTFSLQCSSKGLSQAHGGLLCWKSLALDQKVSTIIHSPCPALAGSSLRREWPPCEHCRKTWRYSSWRLIAGPLLGPELRAATLSFTFCRFTETSRSTLFILLYNPLFLLSYFSHISLNMVTFQPHFLWKLCLLPFLPFLKSVAYICSTFSFHYLFFLNIFLMSLFHYTLE